MPWFLTLFASKTPMRPAETCKILQGLKKVVSSCQSFFLHLAIFFQSLFRLAIQLWDRLLERGEPHFIIFLAAAAAGLGACWLLDSSHLAPCVASPVKSCEVYKVLALAEKARRISQKQRGLGLVKVCKRVGKLRKLPEHLPREFFESRPVFQSSGAEEILTADRSALPEILTSLGIDLRTRPCTRCPSSSAVVVTRSVMRSGVNSREDLESTPGMSSGRCRVMWARVAGRACRGARVSPARFRNWPGFRKPGLRKPGEC
ncbi:unnamed protein product [Symbiodinium natans]|uniref:Uncharacterized protein n=1 Tax=Symbiodinium natans TaxID=878477 RepID=A0A812PDB1_9DINO|nr:unnamed protein product [Symbiodinium natans]